MLEYLILSIAALLAGILNAIAGGGSFLTFPALVFVGVPNVAANATSAVAVFPGYLSSALGFRNEIRSVGQKPLLILISLSVLGGVAGAMLLLLTPSSVFQIVVPWLLLIATLLFAFDRHLKRWSAKKQTGAVKSSVITLMVTTYGGYFNGGLGIVLLSLLSSLGYRDILVMNGLKNVLSFILSAASVLTFTLAGIVYWQQALVMMVAATIGGFLGALLARKLSTQIVRLIVIVVGFGMAAAFFLN